MHRTDAGRRVVDQQDTPGVLVALQPFDAAGPGLTDHRLDRITVLGIPNGGRQDFVHALDAVVAGKPAPGLDRARYRDGMGAFVRNSGDAVVQKPIGFGLARRAAGTVIGDDLR